MVDTGKRRGAVFLFFLLMTFALLFFCRWTEQTTCMDVPVLTEKQQAALGAYVYQDLSRELQYNGQRAAVDLSTSTVYIAQDIQKDTKMEDLLGRLQTRSPSLQLSFAPDQAFENLAEAVEKGHIFQLNVAYGSGKYMQYDLIFTTLPVLRIDGAYAYQNEQFRDVWEGELCLWTPRDPDSNHYSVKTSNVQWHIRGGWSSSLTKPPFKLDLKKPSGTNKNLSMLGLGSDDDWILNPMYQDDTKLKEKLFSTLWNQRAAQKNRTEIMSRGEYVEVVLNQEYWGLFQLQRRIDGKYLNLGAEDILLKGNAEVTTPTVQGAYEIIHSTLADEETYAIVQGFFDGQDADLPNMDNFLDVNLFLQCASAEDNLEYKNMFYLLQPDENGYQMSLLPWDTDMSWGTVWDTENGGFLYNFEKSRQNILQRMEYSWMLQHYPDLDRQMAERWFELRESLLTMENMATILEEEQKILDTSGAQKRDTETWGLFFGGEDSLENLYRILEARLEWVDAYYSQYLQ